MAHLKRSVLKCDEDAPCETLRLMGTTENGRYACACGFFGGCVRCGNLPVTETLGWQFLLEK